MKRIFLILGLVFLVAGCGQKKDAGHAESGHHDEHQEAEVVHLSQASQKLIGLEMAEAKKAPLHTTIDVVGEIAQETENVAHVTAPEAGRLKAYLVGLGEVVEADTPLLTIETKAGAELEVQSPKHGIVLAEYLKPGDRVDNLTSILTVADPDMLRASFNVYEKDLAGIKMGQKVAVSSVAYPDKKFEGEIVFISPAVDPNTRTVKIRVNVSNEEHLLKFGMFVTGKIQVPVSEETLVIPDEAVQEVKGQSVVFIPDVDEPDEFMVRPIRIGRKTQELVEVMDGLEEGDKVAGKGSYYLKSELLKGELEEGHAH
jgi:multidrug efflux pump subunit AcrA (membrane-fusion protein)